MDAETRPPWLGLTAADVSSRLKSVQSDTSGGRGEIGGGRQSIRTLGAVASLEELKAIAIPLPNGQLVRLDEIGTVTDSFSDRSSLVDSCHKRARPIVMTTIAMGCGMLPVALSLSGGDSSFRQPMAIVVIGGLLTSTFLSLLVIPVIFTFVDDVVRFLARILRGRPEKRSQIAAA